jgi:hypothetical protein
MASVARISDKTPTSPKPEGLDLLRAPFPPNQISKLPKPTKAQTEAVKADFKKGIRCKDCGSWHHPEVIHLDYVGHAALTDRLLDTDPEWSWEPLALRDGLPAFDQSGGLWIKLTVCGVSRLGYGHAAAKPGVDPGAREKEVIGDALRNAAMRFGAALDLWHKGDLHADDEDAAPASTGISASQCAELRTLLKQADSSEEAFVEWLKCGTLPELAVAQFPRARKALEDRIGRLTEKPKHASDILEDEVPY